MPSVVPCHALHAPQHASASPFGPLNHSNDLFRPSCRSRLYITGTGKSRYAGFCLELQTPRWIADQALRAPSTLAIATQIQQLYRSSNLSVLCVALQIITNVSTNRNYTYLLLISPQTTINDNKVPLTVDKEPQTTTINNTTNR